MTTLKEIFVFFILPIMLAVGVCYCECRTDEKVWNEGICYYCGGNYEFSNASRGKNQTCYFYYCDNCGNVISTISPQK